MAIWSIVRRKVVNGGHSFASSILGQSWKSTRATASHPGTVELLQKRLHLSQEDHKWFPFELKGYEPSGRVTVSCIQTLNTSIRSFSSDNGGSVDAVVPYMGESISDGNFSHFLKE